MEKHTQALLSSSFNQKVTPSWCNRSKVAITIALILTTTGIIFLGSFLVLDAAETTPPALPHLDAIAAHLSHVSLPELIEEQLLSLENQTIKVRDNNRIRTSQILDVITKNIGFLEGDCPSCWDGPQSKWARLQMQVLRKILGESAVDKLIRELGYLKKDMARFGDELDDNAQKLLKEIGKISFSLLDALVKRDVLGRMGGNSVGLKEVAERVLVISKEYEKFLANSKILENAKLVALY